jgi:hypothetical protein
MLHKNFHLDPYRVTTVQELKPAYYPRLHLCNWLVDNVVNNVEFSQIIIFTDESWYHTSGYLNSKTMRIWSSENPHEIVEQAFYGKKIVVLAGFSQRRIIGPIFFQDYH